MPSHFVAVRYVIGLQHLLVAGIEPVVVTARALALDIGSAEKAKAWNQATAKVGQRQRKESCHFFILPVKYS